MAEEKQIDVFGVPDIQELPMRDRIQTLENYMLADTERQIKIEPVHYFAPGLYAREITIPKGCLLTGKIHLFGHINIISKGDISVLTEDGPKRIVAPATIISEPGIKRVGYAHEDTVWTTVHACSELTPEAAEKALVADSFEEYALRKGERECHLLP